MSLDTLLREAAAVDDPPARALDAARSKLDHSTAAAAARRASAMRALRRRRAHRVGWTALVGVAAAAAFLIVPVLGVGNVSPSSTASAQETLVAASRAAARDLASAPSPYWHTVIQYTDTAAGVDDARFELWAARDGDSVTVDSARPGTARLIGTALYGPGLSWADLDTLPTEAAALDRALRTASAPDDPRSTTDTTVWNDVMELLAGSPATPDLRAALWEVASRLPSATLGDPTADSLGRIGAVIHFSHHTVIIDPETARVLETIDIEVDTGDVHRDTYVEQGPSATAPSAQAPPGCPTANGC